MSLPSKYAIERAARTPAGQATQTPAPGGSAGPIAARNGGSIGGGSATPVLGSMTAASVVGHGRPGLHRLAFDPVDEKVRRVEEVADRARAKFGPHAVIPGTLAA